MTITLSHYLLLSVSLFVIGTLGVLVRRNILMMFMSIEIMLVAANIAILAFARWNLLPEGQIIVLFSFAVIAAEAACGLAIIVSLFKHLGSIYTENARLLKG